MVMIMKSGKPLPWIINAFANMEMVSGKPLHGEQRTCKHKVGKIQDNTR